MRAYLLSLTLLTTLAASLSTTLEPWFQNWQGNRAESGNLLQVALGDSRRMFSQHFFMKADAYFHSGLYATIFDQNTGPNGHPAHCEEGEKVAFLGEPRDWIDRFSRHFYPTIHKHLGNDHSG